MDSGFRLGGLKGFGVQGLGLNRFRMQGLAY